VEPEPFDPREVFCGFYRGFEKHCPSTPQLTAAVLIFLILRFHDIQTLALTGIDNS
jgi:hypothetical protein